MSYSQLHISITFERCSDDRQDSKSLKYNSIPKQVLRKDFNRHIKPHLSKRIKEHGLLPVIYPNRRNAKEPIVIARKFRWFRKEIYKDRYKVERTFG